jgi:hypothetical protein
MEKPSEAMIRISFQVPRAMERPVPYQPIDLN